jgi:hypothetical protein
MTLEEKQIAAAIETGALTDLADSVTSRATLSYFATIQGLWMAGQSPMGIYVPNRVNLVKDFMSTSMALQSMWGMVEEFFARKASPYFMATEERVGMEAWLVAFVHDECLHLGFCRGLRHPLPNIHNLAAAYRLWNNPDPKLV